MSIEPIQAAPSATRDAAANDALTATPTAATVPRSHRAVEAHPHRRIGHSYRQLRRWFRHTPTREIVTVMVSIGVALLFIAVIVGLTAR